MLERGSDAKSASACDHCRRRLSAPICRASPACAPPPPRSAVIGRDALSPLFACPPLSFPSLPFTFYSILSNTSPPHPT
eukprot:scaffold233308_cov26-Tisochrysis_lutea.AAC.1